MVHRAICLDLSNLSRPTKNFGILLYCSGILTFGSQYDVRNGNLFSVLFGETSVIASVEQTDRSAEFGNIRRMNLASDLKRGIGA